MRLVTIADELNRVLNQFLKWPLKAATGNATETVHRVHEPNFSLRQLYFGSYPRIFRAFSIESRVSCGPKDRL